MSQLFFATNISDVDIITKSELPIEEEINLEWREERMFRPNRCALKVRAGRQTQVKVPETPWLSVVYRLAKYE